MHCTRCYRFIEPGADACDGCGFPAPRPPGTDDRSSTPTAAYGGYGGYAAGPYEPSDRSAPSGPYGQYGPSGPYGQYGQYGQYGPSGASGPYGIRPPAGAPPAYGPPPRPTEKISSGRLVVIALVSGAAILLLTVVLLGRQPADRQTGSRRLPAPPSTMRRIPQAPARPATPTTPTAPNTPTTSRSPSPPQPALTFDEAVLAANNLGNAPIDVRDAGTHPTADDVLRLLVEPGDGHETETTVIRDAIHRSATLADGTMVDLTVVDLQDDAAAVTLVDDVRRHSELGVSSPEPELAGAVALAKASPGQTRTIVVPQRNFVIVVTVVWPDGKTPGSPSTPTAQHPLAVATLQSKSLACAPENPYTRAPGC